MPSKRNPLLYFQQMLESIALIERYVTGLTFADFEADIEKQDSVNRRLEIIGEAGHRLKPEDQVLCTEPDWRAMHGLGNLLRHEYDAIELPKIWTIVREDLPVLKEAVERTIKAHFPNSLMP